MDVPKKNSAMMKYLLKSEHAVTEVLDFVVILGILVLSFSMIGVAGYPILKNAQDARYVENTKQSSVIMADNINKVALGQAPSKNMELKMYGGSITVAMDGTMNITANSTNLTTGYIEPTILVDDQLMGSIKNTVGDTVVAYQGTGVWVKYPSGIVLNAYKPLITNQSNVLVIPVVKIIGGYSMAGNGIARIRVEGEPKIESYYNVNDITITITGDYISGWKNYFEDMSEMNWVIGSESGNSYTTKLSTTKNLDVYILTTQMYTEIV